MKVLNETLRLEGPTLTVTPPPHHREKNGREGSFKNTKRSRPPDAIIAPSFKFTFPAAFPAPPSFLLPCFFFSAPPFYSRTSEKKKGARWKGWLPERLNLSIVHRVTSESHACLTVSTTCHLTNPPLQPKNTGGTLFFPVCYVTSSTWVISAMCNYSGPSTTRNPDPASASGFRVFLLSKNCPGVPVRSRTSQLRALSKTNPPAESKARCMACRSRRRAGKGGGVVEQSTHGAHRAPFFFRVEKEKFHWPRTRATLTLHETSPRTF